MVPITNLHYKRVLEQIGTNVIGLQRDMANNAQTHREMAVTKSPPIETLAEFVNAAAAGYLVRLQWGKDIVKTPAKAVLLHGALSRIGLRMLDVTAISDVLETEAAALNSAPKNSYDDIVQACNRVINNVELPPSLWPE